MLKDFLDGLRTCLIFLGTTKKSYPGSQCMIYLPTFGKFWVHSLGVNVDT